MAERDVLPLIIAERDKIHLNRLLLEERARGLLVGIEALRTICEREDDEERRSAALFAKLGYRLPHSYARKAEIARDVEGVR